MELPTDITEDIELGIKFLRDMGTTGAKLGDFLLTYGVEVAASQLKIPSKVLKQTLKYMGTFTHATMVLREVTLRNAKGYVSLTPEQTANMKALVDELVERLGASKLATKLGVSRGTIYHVKRNPPERVTPFVHSVSLLLGYETMTSFMAALAKGVPSHVRVG